MGIVKTVGWVVLIIVGLVVVGLGLTRMPVGGGGGRAAEAYFELQSEYAPDSIVALGRLGFELAESSGLAVSPVHPGIAWTVNDSGNEPMLFAIDGSARTVSRHEVERRLRDPEALATGPCPAPEGAEHCVYLADVGDNDRARGSVRIHVFPEPDPNTARGPDIDPRTLRFRYADGPDDVEAMAVDPDGRITLVTKGRRGVLEVFHIEPDRVEAELDADDPFEIVAADMLPFEPDTRIGRTVTGAGYSPTGARLVVRTYTELFFFEVDGEGRLTLVREPCMLGSAEPQGEAVAFLDESTVLTTSESARGRAGQLLRVHCR